jgi:DNA-binding Xre family transcriptional regulator
LHYDATPDGEIAHAAIIAATVVRLPGLRRQRLLAALTQDQLAAKAGLQRGTVNRLEQGKDCHPTTVRKLADALSCQPKDLMEPEA